VAFGSDAALRSHADWRLVAVILTLLVSALELRPFADLMAAAFPRCEAVDLVDALHLVEVSVAELRSLPDCLDAGFHSLADFAAVHWFDCASFAVQWLTLAHFVQRLRCAARFAEAWCYVSALLVQNEHWLEADGRQYALSVRGQEDVLPAPP
jgi:hypothetical protein